jgi:hypothetical protein
MPSLHSKKFDPIVRIELMIVALTVIMGVGFFVLYFKSELDLQQIGSEIGIIRGQLENKVIHLPGYKPGMTTEEFNKIRATVPTIDNGTDAVVYVNIPKWDLKMKYPENRFAVLVDDAGQKDLRITSSKGELALQGGAAVDPAPDSFSSGYQIIVHKLDPQQQPIGPQDELVPMPNKLVKNIVGPCQDVGCPAYQYLITTSRGDHYLMLADYSPDFNPSELNHDLEGIIASIQEK